MKITEMTNEQATEALVRLTEPLSNICDDAEIMDFLGNLKGEGKESVPVLKVFSQLVALTMKKHKNDLYEVVAALQLIPVAQVGGMNFMQTVKAVKDSYDDILAGFFTKSGVVTQNSEEESAQR